MEWKAAAAVELMEESYGYSLLAYGLYGEYRGLMGIAEKDGTHCFESSRYSFLGSIGISLQTTLGWDFL